MKTTATSTPSWLSELLRGAGLSENSPFGDIEKEMDRLAMRSQPVARSRSVGIVVLEGLCVLVPALWMIRRWTALSPAAAAGAVLVSVLALIAALWWMRWRGMQRTWARARLLAEVARSREAGAVVPGVMRATVLKQIPALEAWLETRTDGAAPAPWPAWRDTWITRRVENQLAFYRKAMDRAEAQRKRFTRMATLTMDVMLALSVAALLLALNGRSAHWMRLLGNHRLEFFLGIAGMLLPLALILIQTLRSMLDLNRRPGRFARQVEMLEKAKSALQAAPDEAEALRIVQETEGQLLGEVFEWYFETESAESFVRVREMQDVEKGAGRFARRGHGALAKWAWAIGGLGFFFLVRVILGRAPWALGAAGITLCWLSYATPTDADARSELHGNGRLVDATGATWVPDLLREENGCIIIAHGLHDGAMKAFDGAESRWMRGMHAALEKRLADNPPNIALVDWYAEASPTGPAKLNPGIPAAKFAADLAGIPSQGREVGDYLAFRLFQLIVEKRIRRDRPLHLIGHSAGGFVVARAAHRLSQMSLAPERMQVTILDTPESDAELLEELPRVCRVDFYITSDFVRRFTSTQPRERFHVVRVPSKEKLGLLEQHSFAHEWYIQSIPTAKPGDDGFGQSPFAR